MSRPWMPLYIADYRKDTGHLSATEHGAYLLLIMHYWATGGLPNDDRQIARITCMSLKQWERIKPVIVNLFGEGWRHKRIDAELARAAEISNKRKAAAMQKHSKSSANAEQMDTQSQSQSPLQTKEEESGGAEAPSDNVIPIESAGYAFCGNIIRLKPSQLERWRKSYPHIPDITAALETADAYYSDRPPKDGKWFFAASSWLQRENDKYQRNAKQAEKEQARLRGDAW